MKPHEKIIRLPPVHSRHRMLWAVTRSVMESNVYKHRKHGIRRRRHWPLFETMIAVFDALLKMTPWYEIGYRNATDIVVNRIDMQCKDLPPDFDGYTLLHLTDLHLDFIRGMETTVCDRIRELTVDACVITGDFRERISGGFQNILHPLEKIVQTVKARDGIFATLGNHDTCLMVEPLENMGIHILANETVQVSRNGNVISFTGLDDPWYYYTDQAVRALEISPNGFKIALVHSPSLFEEAAENGYGAYLCGHTHGGQICLPGGRPVVLHLRYGRKYYRGLWNYNGMKGYTGQGTGCIGIPIRFFTQSEITLITLKTEA